MSIKVHANDGISAEGKQRLESAGIELLENKVAQEQLANFINENGVQALLVRSATKVRKELIDECPGLKLIGRGGVGMDNIDVDYARSKGLQVINTPAASSDSVAELVFGHLFSLARFLHDANRNMPLEGETRFKELKKAYSQGKELGGKTLGIIGCGRIGQSVARIGLGLGMKIVYHDPFIEHVTIKLPFYDGRTMDFDLKSQSVDDILAQSDFITLHVPAQKDGSPVIGSDQIEKMKKGVILVNASRGGIIDEVALLNAIEDKKIMGAGLDVFDKEPTPSVRLLMNPELSLSPHIGASTSEAQARIGLELAEKIISHFEAY
jgi:D-3-phosphoglycerate dehydrogenase